MTVDERLLDGDLGRILDAFIETEEDLLGYQKKLAEIQELASKGRATNAQLVGRMETIGQDAKAILDLMKEQQEIVVIGLRELKEFRRRWLESLAQKRSAVAA